MKKLFFMALSLMAVVMLVTANVNAQDKKAKSAEVTFSVNIDCKNCVKKLEAKLPFEPGVKDLKVNLDEHTVWFVYAPDKTNKEQLAKAIEKLGYSAKEIEKTPAK